MSADTQSLLTLLALILASGALTMGVILVIARYCLGGEDA